MKSSLMNNFGEACYMSCGLMDTKREAIVHIKATISKLTEKEFSIFTYLFRYFLIMLIGFDIAQRTTPPWAKQNLKHDNENIEINRE